MLAPLDKEFREERIPSDKVLAFRLEKGALLLEGPKQAPTGMEMRVKHPDGAVIKYVQYHGSVYSR
ncbi:MAG TPA: hypothetical protein VFA10_14930 [Ktedonobacteraceae bacterium]|nr:hypothetical protein [Ktedonobacteraceae bacterium]